MQSFKERLSMAVAYAVSIAHILEPSPPARFAAVQYRGRQPLLGRVNLMT